MGAIEVADLTEESATDARAALRALQPLLSQQAKRSAPRRPINTAVELRRHAGKLVLRPEGETHEEVVVPLPAFKLFVEILAAMANGQGVTVMPLNAELTTQQAADILNVSRPFVIHLIAEKKLHAKKVGTHRRIRLADVLEYKERDDRERKRVLDELSADAQDLGDY